MVARFLLANQPEGRRAVKEEQGKEEERRTENGSIKNWLLRKNLQRNVPGRKEDEILERPCSAKNT